MATFLEIANNIAVKVRLPEMTGCFSSPDRNARVIKLAIIDSTRRNIFKAFDWSFLLKKHTFATVNEVAAYNVPVDYDRIINNTVWNNTAQRRISGPTNAQKWALYQNDAFGVSSIDYTCKILPSATGQKQLNLEPEPTSTEAISYYYISNKYIVSESTLVAAYTNDDDTSLFDDDLVEQAALYRVLRTIGLDYGEEKYEYEQLLHERTSHDGGAENLKMDGPSEDTLILGANTPLTGFGS